MWEGRVLARMRQVEQSTGKGVQPALRKQGSVRLADGGRVSDGGHQGVYRQRSSGWDLCGRGPADRGGTGVRFRDAGRRAERMFLTTTCAHAEVLDFAMPAK